MPLLTAAVAAALLTGCSGKLPNPFGPDEPENTKQLGETGFIRGFLGGVVADDPQAAVVGRDILSAGGSAADAMTAMYFTLAVTKPTNAGLGGGGVCVIRDNLNKRNDVLSFPAVLPQDASGRNRGAVPIPGNPRGFAVLHARLGSLKWAQIVQPAENLARFGNVVSRAFATDLKRHAARLAGLPEVAALFRKRGARHLADEGDRMDRLRLAGVLGRIRVRGVGDFYQGQLARDFVEDANSQGGALTIEDMREYLPEVRPAVTVPYIERTEFLFPSPPLLGGVLAAELTGVLMQSDYAAKDTAERTHLFAEAALAVQTRRADWLRRDGLVTRPAYFFADEDRYELIARNLDDERHVQKPAAGDGAVPLPDGADASGLVAIDKYGSAVACTVSMNGPLGAGKVAPSLGFILARPAGADGVPPVTATPIILVGEERRKREEERVFLAATVTGGPGGTEALVDLALRTTGSDDSLEAILGGPRLYYADGADALVIEPGLPKDLQADLRRRGHTLHPAASGARINAIYCETGVPSGDQVCGALADPRGFGLGAVGDR
jgi:gamma-glutamyltranspeptidase/glutathione hydrolase